MSRRGARPIEETLRNLLAIMDALSRKGSVIDAKGVSYLLGITREEAAEAIGDVLEAATGADASMGVVLPMEGDAERGISLMEGTKPLRALRMTTAEAQALMETLDILGVDEQALGGIRPKIERAFYPRGMRRSNVREREASSLPGLLVLCLDALYCNRGLRFAYAGERGEMRERIVEPLSLQYLFGQWVLDALDLTDELGVSRETGGDDGTSDSCILSSDSSLGLGSDNLLEEQPDSELRDSEIHSELRSELQSVQSDTDTDTRSSVLDRRRFFLVNRLPANTDAIALVKLPTTHVWLRNLPWDEGGQWVRLYFTDRSRYDRNSEWTWSREVPRADLTRGERLRIGPEGCAVDVRHFPGSPYLIRLIVSCAGTCTTDDPALRAAIATYLDSLP